VRRSAPVLAVEQSLNPSEDEMAGKIFVSYRRNDSVAHAGRLHDRLASEFGPDRICGCE
jgi:hypothetical protein